MKTINNKLDKYIFSTLNFNFSPDYSKAKSNLENSKEDNENYLATYFPRSFFESYKIFSNIFSNQKIYSKFNEQEKIVIVDIGSGTGGNVFGLLQVLVEKFQNKKINIYTFDGNKNALDIQKKIYDKYEELFPKSDNHISFIFNKIEICNKADIDTILKFLDTEDKKIDILSSFKFINEFYNKSYKRFSGMYMKFLEFAQNNLSDNGICVLCDLTYKLESTGTNIPTYMNRECRDFFKNKKLKLKYIIPKCCCKNIDKCFRDYCYSAISFKVNHSGNNSDVTKIVYKLFINGKLGEQIKNDICNGSSSWCDNNNEQCYCENTCRNNSTAKNERIADLTEPYIL